jgi:hypothetical protein
MPCCREEGEIGQILERQGDAKGALDAFTKFLEIQWNQPPIIEAKSRLTRQIEEIRRKQP